MVFACNYKKKKFESNNAAALAFRSCIAIIVPAFAFDSAYITFISIAKGKDRNIQHSGTCVRVFM